MLRLSNLPDGLKGLVPKDSVPEHADLVVLDRASLDAATKAAGELGEAATLLRAYSRLRGAEHIVLPVADLPGEHQSAAGQLAVSGTLAGEALVKALEAPESLSAELRAAIPPLAELFHEEMGKAELLKGTLSKGLPDRRANHEEISRWFAAAVAELRAQSGVEPIGLPGAKRLIKLSQQVLLNYGAGLITRSFFDEAVRDLHDSPGLQDEALGALEKFRQLTQPGRSSHERTEMGALIKLDAAIRKKKEQELLNPTQLKAVAGVTERQSSKVEEARAKLLAKMTSLGMAEADLDRLIAYLKSYARVTVQFHPDKKLPDGKVCVDSFLEDPFYKNQFETKISSGSLGPKEGSSRDGWEKKLFDGAYHDHPLIPEERPKYGGLSPLNSPQGNGGNWYGRCFLELRQDVKWRTTFTPRNSSGCSKDDVSTIETLEILLSQIADRDANYFKKMMEVAKGDKVSVAQSYSNSYIEAQVHGSLDLSRDVDFIVIDKSYTLTPYGQKLLKLAEMIGATPKFTDQSRFYMADEEKGG